MSAATIQTAASKLDAPKFLLWSYLVALADQGGIVHPLQADIAAALRQSLRSVQRTTTELRNLGALTHIRDTNRGSIYRVENPNGPDLAIKPDASRTPPLSLVHFKDREHMLCKSDNLRSGFP